MSEGYVYLHHKSNREIEIIRSTELVKLQDVLHLENELIPSLGFNDENLYEQPEIVKSNTGGLRIWQYPNQFSKYLIFLSEHNVKSYIEIGCRWGGTFILTTEYLRKLHPDDKIYSVAVDIIDSPVRHYEHCKFLQCSTRSFIFEKFIRDKFFDVCFIDGDHSYEGVKSDYNICKTHARIFVFHDIVSDVCPGVVKFWNEIKTTGKEYHEFTEQYSDVNGIYLGIGIVIF